MVFHESLNQERKFSLAIPLFFIAILGGTTAVIEVAIAVSPNASYAVNSQAQSALAVAGVSSDGSSAIQQSAAPASTTDGQCQRTYELCVANAKSEATLSVCESNWRTCVSNKCVKKDTSTIDQCLKDSDCIKSCTELTAANGELKSCCSVIEHNNMCRTKVEQVNNPPICNPEQTKLPDGSTGSGTKVGDVVTDIAATESKIAALNEEKRAFDESNSGGIFPWEKEEELKQAEQTLSEQKSAYEQITGYSYDDPVAPTSGDANNPTDQDLFDAEGVAKQENINRLQAEQSRISAELAKDPNNEELLYKQEAINRELASQSTFISPTTQFDSSKSAGDGALVPAEQPKYAWYDPRGWFSTPTIPPDTSSLSDGTVAQVPPAENYDWPRDFNYETAGAVDPNVAKAAAEDAWTKDFNYETAGSKTDSKPATAKPGDRVPVPLPPPRPSGADTPDPPPPSGGNSSAMSGLNSMLQGLMKGLSSQPPSSAPAQTCSSDPNAYNQQQQQYQAALQQYNYQLQLYNQQQQQASIYGMPAPIPPVAPAPCTPSTGSQCQSQPPQPNPANCTTGPWQPTYNGSCITSWSCPSAPNAPTATLSCEPKVADVGMTLAITYGCSSGTATSTSFTVTTQPGGSATTTVANPPSGTNTATYNLSCTDQGKTTGAQCSVQVNKPSIILVANPKTVLSGDTSLLSWLTTGMQSCIISSPDQADFTTRNSSNTSVNGAAESSVIATSSTSFQLDCKTLAGTDKQATTSVTLSP